LREHCRGAPITATAVAPDNAERGIVMITGGSREFLRAELDAAIVCGAA